LRAGRSGALVLASMAAFIAATGLSAHRRDEYLQAARLSVEPSRVAFELDLTPGIDIADSIIATIDSDGDASLSRDEQRAYAGHVLEALELTLDGAPLEMRLTSCRFPELSAFYQGEGTIRLEIDAAHPGLSPGAHRLWFRNGHRSGQSAYLANALVPESARVSVTGQRRDSLQSELTIDYQTGGTSAGSPAGWLLVGVPFAAVLLLRFTRVSRR